MRMQENEFESIKIAVNGIVFNNFGSVAMEMLTCYDLVGGSLIKLTVCDKPCRCEDRKTVIKQAFVFKGVHDTVLEIEEHIVNFSNK